MLDAYISGPHYEDHLRPVWDALPREVRGTWWRQDSDRRDRTRTVLVTSVKDARTMDPSPLVYVEHGAGQTYVSTPDHPLDDANRGSYSGGPGLDRVVLFLCPSQRVASNWEATYPDTPTVVVGVPKLDPWHGRRRAPWVATPTVAITFHWDLGMVPETRSAWRFYEPHLSTLNLDPRWNLLGHSHPRLWHRMSRVYNRLRIHATPTLADVFDRADLLVADNTSAMYEFASLDRPVVAVNLPTYRRDVHHGMRFWNLVPGLQCDTPQDLPDVIAAALVDPPEAQAMRTRAVDATYAHTDGGASERAASAILEHLCLTPTQRKGGPEPPPVNAGQ